MRGTRWIGGLTVTAGVAAALLAGGGTALADAGTPPAPVAKDACTVRIPALLARIDKVTTRINADASTKGSTAWLQARAAAARAAGHAAAADLLDLRIANRPHRLEDVARAKASIEAVRTKDCTG